MSGPRFENWRDEFATKFVTAEEAVRAIEPNSRVAIPIGASVPNLSDALFARAGELERVDIVVCAPGYDPGWFEPGHPAFQMHVEVFNSALARPALVDRRIDFISVPFSRRFKNWDERGSETKPADTVLISISPPDENGFCSFGLSAWNKRTYVRRAGRVIAEIRDNYPMTGGTNQVHVTELDAIVPGGEHQFPEIGRAHV